MKKLYEGRSGGGGRRGKVHPSPTPTNLDHYPTLLAALPAAILALTAALTAEDREVLAYLISCGGERRTHLEEGEKMAARRRRAGGATAEGPPPPPVFGCTCFHCYTSYWARWDASPNRQLIHEIIDALEEEENQLGAAGRKKAKPARRGRSVGGAKGGRRGGGGALGEDVTGLERGSNGGHVGDGLQGEDDDGADEEEEEEKEEEDDDEEEGEGEERKSSPVRRLVNYLGERIWGVWSL